MAKLSEETQAIINRLKAEGDLIRNSGTNSLRSVKVELGKFEGVFQSINTNLIDQTNMLKAASALTQEQLESQRRREDFEEVQRNEESKEKVKTGPPGPVGTDKGESVMGALMSGGIGGIFKDFAKIALGGVGMFAAYNFAKGYIDEKSGGGFTKFETSMITTFKETDWAKVGTSFKDFAEKVPEALLKITDFLTNPVTYLVGGASAAALSLAIKGISTKILTDKIVDKVLRDQGIDGTGGGDKKGGKGPKPKPKGFFNLRMIGAGLVGAAIAAVEGPTRDWIAKQEWSDTEIAGIQLGDAADTAAIAGGSLGMGMTLAALFGLGALGLPTLVIGGTIALARIAYKYIQKKNAEAEASFIGKFDEMEAAIVEAGEAGPSNLTPEQLSNIQDIADKGMERIARATENATEAQIKRMQLIVLEAEKILAENMDPNEIKTFGNRNEQFSGAIRSNIATALEQGDTAGIKRLAEFAGQQYDDSFFLRAMNFFNKEKYLERALGGMIDQYFRDLGDPNDPTDNVSFVPFKDRAKIKEQWESLLAETLPGLSSGTGFGPNFGTGTPVMLHGKEAVVPFNTPAGQLLNTFFDKNLAPRMSGMEGILNRVEGAAGGQGTVVINNAPTVAPTVSNVIQGGSVMQNTTLLNTAGGGSSPMLPGGVH
jgi:hypothetical protein